VRSWNLNEIETPSGSRSPVVLDSDEAARVVLIGLDPGQELGEHQVKEHAFVLVVEGTVRVDAAGESLEAPTGTLFTSSSSHHGRAWVTTGAENRPPRPSASAAGAAVAVRCASGTTGTWSGPSRT
jgi:hypothetical protein